MNSDDVQLNQVLSDFPHLRRALGERWIAREQRTDPVLSKFPLARALRVEELRDHIATLDRLLGSFESVPGTADWRKRLQSNGPEFREILTEATFASLLREHGFQFLRPEKGPDFEVDVGEGHTLLVEVTTPRKVAWADDLDNRLRLLGRRLGYSVRTEPLVESSPILELEIREWTVPKIIDDAIDRLTNAPNSTTKIEQEWRQLGLRIIWTPSEAPMFSGYNSPNSSPMRAFSYLVEAAHEKERQLPKGRACVLVVGANQLPFPEWHQYLVALRNGNSDFGPFDWSMFPDRLRCLILFSASYVDSHPPTVDVVVRADDPLIDPPGIERFIGELVSAGEAGRQPDSKVMELIAALIAARDGKSTDVPNENATRLPWPPRSY